MKGMNFYINFKINLIPNHVTSFCINYINQIKSGSHKKEFLLRQLVTVTTYYSQVVELATVDNIKSSSVQLIKTLPPWNILCSTLSVLLFKKLDGSECITLLNNQDVVFSLGRFKHSGLPTCYFSSWPWIRFGHLLGARCCVRNVIKFTLNLLFQPHIRCELRNELNEEWHKLRGWQRGGRLCV